VHGCQEGSAYNGHFRSRCYHPLFVFNQFGDCEAGRISEGKGGKPGVGRSSLPDGW